METLLTRDQSRLVDRIAIEEFHVPGIVLMENAGRGAAEVLMKQEPNGPVVILCGKGNNGGDGFVMARHLQNAGLKVEVIQFFPDEQYQGDAAINLQIVDNSNISRQQIQVPQQIDQLQQVLSRADWIVDALLGTGLQGAAREPFLSIIKLINVADKKVLAVDVPSGFDCDLGPIPEATVNASVTTTFVAGKVGFQDESASDYLGTVEVIGIGMPNEVLRKVLDTPLTSGSRS